MRLFKKLREKRINLIIERVNKKNIFKRYLMLLFFLSLVKNLAF